MLDLQQVQRAVVLLNHVAGENPPFGVFNHIPWYCTGCVGMLHHVVVKAEKGFSAGWSCFGVGGTLLWALSELLGEKGPWYALRADMPQIWIKHHQGTDRLWLTAS